MITVEMKSKIDAVWNDFWSGRISNPLEGRGPFIRSAERTKRIPPPRTITSS